VHFCDALKEVGNTVLRPETPVTELDRAEGWRHLTRLLRIALETQLEYADPDFPVFYSICHETAKMGGDNPDNFYRTATIRGEHDYRIRGRLGDADYVSFGTKANRFAVDGSMVSTGELEGIALETDADGNFEIAVSGSRRARNWLELAPDSSIVLVRETFRNRRRARPAVLEIERVDAPAAPAPLSAARIEAALRGTVAFMQGSASMFGDWAQRFQTRSNTLDHIDQAFYQRAGGDPAIYYCHGHWRLQPDEALVIETPVPPCATWNFQVDNYWMESLDYRYSRIHLNDGTAKLNPDGSVAIVVAARDPGVPNWLSTTGHDSGTMLLRWVRAAFHPTPGCRVVKLDSLGAQHGGENRGEA
jgi:hypothetical protein